MVFLSQTLLAYSCLENFDSVPRSLFSSVSLDRKQAKEKGRTNKASNFNYCFLARFNKEAFQIPRLFEASILNFPVNSTARQISNEHKLFCLHFCLRRKAKLKIKHHEKQQKCLRLFFSLAPLFDDFSRMIEWDN